MSSDHTTEILEAWTLALYVTALETVSLMQANFSVDEPCQALADFINVATGMTSLELEYQDSVRPIKVNVTPASAEGVSDGTITITDYSDESVVILTQSTTRTQSLYVTYA